MNNIIVGMGEALWDVLPEGKKIGGAPANFAYHVSQFGFDSRVVSAVGNDELGDEILRVFNEKKLKTPIINAIFSILYEGKDAEKQFEKLTAKLN
jgi:fructokinase